MSSSKITWKGLSLDSELYDLEYPFLFLVARPFIYRCFEV